MTARFALAFLAVALFALPSAAQVSGTVFEDRDGDGVRDAGEPGIEGIDVVLFGSPDAGGAVDQTAATLADGSFSFAPGNGCYLLLPVDPAGWRMSVPRDDGFAEGTPGYDFPVGTPRFGKMDQGIDHLRNGSFRFAAMGDSIAYNFNLCSYVDEFWYSNQVRSRIACAAPGASIPLVDEVAVKGEHTDDLLVDDTDDDNNVFRILEMAPDLVTLSMIGNDLLDVDPGNSPTPAETNAAVAELLDARQNLQEAVSTILAGLPGADVALNTVYDNEAYNCNTGSPTDFHVEWFPILRRVLRDLAWGQIRRVSTVEAAADFAHEDLAGACTGFDGLICRDLFQLDTIHPTNDGYALMREKLWEAVGGTTLGPGDATGRTAIPDADYGYLRRIRRLLPTAWETRDGAVAGTPGAAADDQDGGAAAAVTLGAGTEEFRLDGFPTWFDEDRIVRVIAGVRYRTTGTVADDFYRVEASVTGTFRPPPGHDYTTTDWNFYTPIVGGGGPNRPAENPDYPGAKVLAFPDVPSYREVSALLTKNPVLTGGAVDYDWPAIDHADLATTTIRLASAPVAATPGNDPYQVEVDAVWLDVYGWQEARPDEVTDLRVDREADGTLHVAFDEKPGAGRYNLYFGRLETVRAGGYDHGSGAPAGPICAAATAAAGPGRLEIAVSPGTQPGGDSYLLVTAHVDEVESPSGTRTGGDEIDRAQSVCQ